MAAVTATLVSCGTSEKMLLDNGKGDYPSYPEAQQQLRIMDTSLINDLKNWGVMNTHDPSVFYDEASGNYYVYSTDATHGGPGTRGLQIRKSQDLISWEYLGTAMQGIPKEVSDYTNCVNLWAPDVIRVGDEYRMYYSASTFGSQRSAISLAVADNPEGPFTHKEIVLRSEIGAPVNAIDPNIITDEKSGQMYMVYGSFWGGINLLKLDSKTGLAAESGYGINIAKRSSAADGSVEGPYIKYNADTGYYYLFVSYGSLSSDYNIRVARSKEIEGPYLDKNGREMTEISSMPDEIGFKISGGYTFNNSTGWMATGHNSVLCSKDNEWFLVNHARPAGVEDWFYMQVRLMVWTDDGWPLANPSLYAGEQLQSIDKNRINGSYERIKHMPLTWENSPQSENMKLYSNGVAEIGEESGKWEFEDDILTVEVSDSVEKYFVIPSWDYENNKQTITITGLDDQNICIWGKKE